MNILILGNSVSGKAAKKLADILNYNAKIVNDSDEEFPNFDNIQLLVTSPGVSDKSKILTMAKKLSVKIISELEFGYLALPNSVKILSITGTNGKTTTTELTTHLLKYCKKSAVYAGNIGVPLSEISCDIISEKLAKDSIIVIEVSSFQLEYVDKFKSLGAVILNIASDHLNRYHGSIEEYKQTKSKIFQNVNPNNCYWGKSMPEYKKSAVAIENNDVLIFSKKLINYSDLKIKGEHNLENLIASLELLTLVLDEKELFSEEFKNGLKTFETGKHRIQQVPYKDDILVINDSKATNPASTIAAIKSIETPNQKDILLILGGLDKDMDFREILPYIACVKKCYLIGETKDKLAEVLKNIVEFEKFNDFKSCIDKVKSDAEKSEKILFSPACASMDMFKNYQERGDIFMSFF